MKHLLLAAINAKYIHSNLAVYSLKSCAGQYQDRIDIAEYTINEQTERILEDLYKRNPAVLLFSCYIWNWQIVEELAGDFAKIRPDCPIWLGGPEVSYRAESFLLELPNITGVMVGEGEKTLFALAAYYLDQDAEKGLFDIPGLIYREGDKIISTGPCDAPDFTDLPFPLAGDLREGFKNRILYYESSRGCPFSCSYCLSSIDKRVRFRELSLVKEEIGIFLKYCVPQVKFVDRTFNCNSARALKIWTFLKENDNGITNFHFEIAADILTEEELELLSGLRPGQVQLEIGIQTVNPDTLQEIHRVMDFRKAAYAIGRIQKAGNIHLHLDLIAGLPKEDFLSFQASFGAVYMLKPNQLQLGFLKVLQGTQMKYEAEELGILYKSKPPFEVLSTPWISYQELLCLKRVEEMVEIYYNSAQFCHAIRFLEYSFSYPFDLYCKLGEYYEKYFNLSRKHSRLQRYEYLLDFAATLPDFQSQQGRKDGLAQLLLLDLYSREKLKSRPGFAKVFHPTKSEFRNILGRFGKYAKAGEAVHLEAVTIDIGKALDTGLLYEKPQYVLFCYGNSRDLNGNIMYLTMEY